MRKLQLNCYRAGSNSFFTLDLERFFDCTIHYLNPEEIQNSNMPYLVVITPDLEKTQDEWFEDCTFLKDWISKDQQAGRCRVCCFFGLSECNDLECLRTTLDAIKQSNVDLERMTLVLDSTLESKFLTDILSILSTEYSEIQDIRTVAGFRNLKWGWKVWNSVEESHLEEIGDFLTGTITDIRSIFNASVSKALRMKYENAKILAVSRRSDDVGRLYVLSKILDGRKERFNYAFNIGRDGNLYSSLDKMQCNLRELLAQRPNILVPEIDRPYVDTWNQGSTVYGRELDYSFFDIRDQCFLNLVEEHTNYITEKTYKMMVTAYPCLFLGQKGLIKILHDQGFQTFDRWWDESYDELEYGVDKVDAIFKIVDELLQKTPEELKQMFEEMVPTLLWNVENLMRQEDRLAYLFREFIPYCQVIE